MQWLFRSTVASWRHVRRSPCSDGAPSLHLLGRWSFAIAVTAKCGTRSTYALWGGLVGILLHGLQSPARCEEQSPAQKKIDGREALCQMTIVEQQEAMSSGRITAKELARLYLSRISMLDFGGPRLRSVLEINPEALSVAEMLDQERKLKGPRSALHGICVLLKDNVETADLMHTTAGSLALMDSKPCSDAEIVSRLRAAGAIILGKANLSEWANYRGNSSSGWSCRGGQCLNPHVLGITPWGSSAGSGAAVAAALTAVAVGSETDGSIVMPADVMGIVGVKPTVGLISQHGIIPISSVQDTAGPMTRTVEDAAILLTVLSTKSQNFAQSLSTDGLKGVRLGILRSKFEPPLRAMPIGVHEKQEMQQLLSDEASQELLRTTCLEPLEAAGATLVDVELWSSGELEAIFPAGRKELHAAYDKTLGYEFARDISKYLKTRRIPHAELGSRASMPDSLEELIIFNLRHKDEELCLFGQELFEEALSTSRTLPTEEYQQLSAKLQQAGGKDGIDKLLSQNNLDALVCPSSAGASFPASICGYPVVSVPAGVCRGVPFGCAFIGTAFSESTLLRLAYAFEQRTQALCFPQFRMNVEPAPNLA